MADPEHASPDPSPTGDDRPSTDAPIPLDRLTEALYPELRRLARRAMRNEHRGHTLQATAVVHEAYLRLAGQSLEVESRAHFLALSARLMRRILIDHARTRSRDKRGGGQFHVTLTEGARVDAGPRLELFDLDRALRELSAFDDRRARLLELQIFGGLTYPEMAEALAISEATVHRELRLARAWLQRQLASPETG